MFFKTFFSFFICLLSLAACKFDTSKTPSATTAAVATAEPEKKMPATVSQIPYAAGDDLSVFSIIGLNLRTSPDVKAAKIAKIPYGAQVKVLPDGLGLSAYHIEDFKGYKLEGHWVKVAYAGKSGYLFDGYLLHRPAPKKKETMEAYLERTTKLTKKDTIQPANAPKVFAYEHREYADGTTYTYTATNERSANTEIVFPVAKLSLTEAYLLIKSMNTADLYRCKYTPKKSEIQIDADENRSTVTDKNGQIVMNFSTNN